MDDTAPGAAVPQGTAGRIITGWALTGGLFILAVVLVNAVSIVGSAAFGAPFPGDFELTEMLSAIGVSCFLPYCQLTGANVTADIFTAGASPRWLARFRALASAVALAFALLLVWRMSFGMLDQKANNYTTAILQTPIWWGYAPFLVSLALLGWASLVTLRVALREAS